MKPRPSKARSTMIPNFENSYFTNQNEPKIFRKVHPPLLPSTKHTNLPKLFMIVTLTLLTFTQSASAIHLLSANSLILNTKPLPSSSPFIYTPSSSSSSSSSPSSSSSSSSSLPSSSLSHSNFQSNIANPKLSHPTVTPNLVNSEYDNYRNAFEQRIPRRIPRNNNKLDTDSESIKAAIEDATVPNVDTINSGEPSAQNTDTELLKLFESIDSRLNKMQQQIQPNANSFPDPGGHFRPPFRSAVTGSSSSSSSSPSSSSSSSSPSSPSSSSSSTGSSTSSGSNQPQIPVPLSPAYFFSTHNLGGGNGHFWLSSIRNHFLNLESTLHAKLGSIETKLTNMDVESSIWKKTFAWKVDEINLRIVQTESKSTLTHEQILNKLDHFERTFHDISSETMSKIFHLTEKISKMEHGLQQRFNALERNIGIPLNDHVNDNLDINSFVPDKNEHLSVTSNHHNSIPLSSPLSSSFASPVASPLSSSPKVNSETQQKSFKSDEASTVQATGTRSPFAFQIPKSSFLSKLSNSYHNSTRADSGKLKFAQRFMKLINSKQNTTMYQKTMRLNNTYLDAYLQQQKERSMNRNTHQPTTPQTIAGDMKNDPAKQKTEKSSKLQKEQIESMKPLTTNIHNRNIDTLSQVNIDSNDVGHGFVTEQDIDYGRCQQLLTLLNIPQKANVEDSLVLCRQLIGATFQLQAQNNVQETQNKNPNITGGKASPINIRLSPIEKRNLNEEIVTNNSLHPYDTLANNFEHYSNAQHAYKKTSNGQESQINKVQDNVGAVNQGSAPSMPSSSSSPQQAVPQASQQQANSNVGINSLNPTPLGSNGQPASPQQFDETLEALGAEMKADTKLDELDAKLQYFSTKIIKIVQEMWHSSRASENYLKQTLTISNETKSIVRTEMADLQHRLKPVDQLPNVIDEIREPLINRIQELSTALNNSVEVILNTQSQYINSCRLMREEELQMQIYEVLEYFLNKSNMGFAALSHNMEQQEQQMNRTVEFLLYRLSGISKQTMDSIRTESLRLETVLKSEIERQIGVLQENRGFALNMTHHALFEHLANISNKVFNKQFKPFHSTSSSPNNANTNGQSAGSGSQCTNECFISKEDFANICFNMNDRKAYFPDAAQPSVQPPATPPINNNNPLQPSPSVSGMKAYPSGVEVNTGTPVLSSIPSSIPATIPTMPPSRVEIISSSHQSTSGNTLPHLYQSTESTLSQNSGPIDVQTPIQSQSQQPQTTQQQQQQQHIPQMVIQQSATSQSQQHHQQPLPDNGLGANSEQHSPGTPTQPQQQQQPSQISPQLQINQQHQQQAQHPLSGENTPSTVQILPSPTSSLSGSSQISSIVSQPVSSSSSVSSPPQSSSSSSSSSQSISSHYKPITNQTQPIANIEINHGNR